MDWLMKMLGMQQGGGGMPFGALGGSSGPAANNGMPMSGVGPGLWSPPGANPTQPNANQQGNPQGALMNQAMNLIKGPQLQPAPWMQMMPMGTMRG